MTRRQIMALAGSAPVWLAATSNRSSAATAPVKPKMGGAPTAFALRSRGNRQAFDIVEHCHNIGLAGVQANPPAMDPASIKKFRARVEGYNMHLISDVRLPQNPGEVEAFDGQVKALKEAGAVAVHVALTGRRYEQFDNVQAWKAMVDTIHKTTELAEPVLRKNQIRLGMENHKGYRSVEQAAFLKRLGSEWVGVCLDFGNNLSLCEDPMDTLNTLLPYTMYAHIKDMAVEEYEDGFLLSEVVMGDGFLDLKGMVAKLRQKDPNMIFELEMITRDPLKIPVYTNKYWATFDDTLSPLPGRDLAKTLALVKKNHPEKPLPKIAGLSPEAQVKLEDDLNNANIAWAKANLEL